MTDPKGKRIPDWQREGAPESDELEFIEPKPISEASTPVGDDKTPTRAELVSQAAAWLDHQHIRDAPLEGKITFLEGKGLTEEEIHKALGVNKATKSQSASAATAATSSDLSPAPRPETSTTETSRQPQPQPPSTDSSTPPIITYPEFLLKPPPKPPLVSRTTLLRTAYGTALTAGALHVASNYFVEPMLAELSSARHEFFGIASKHLDTLNEKLTNLVSVVPVEAQLARSKVLRDAKEDIDDESSEASDPSELFHRDMGVQTSDPPSPASHSDQDGNTDSISRQATKLSALQAHLSTLRDSCADYDAERQDVDAEMSKLENFLNDLKYSRRNTMLRGWEGSLPGGVSYMGESGSKDGKGKDEDAIDRVKAEIKGVKGVLLSARSFPGGVRAGVR